MGIVDVTATRYLGLQAITNVVGALTVNVSLPTPGINISKPTKLTITYTPNYTRLYIVMGVIVMVLAILIIVMRMSNKK